MVLPSVVSDKVWRLAVVGRVDESAAAQVHGDGLAGGAGQRDIGLGLQQKLGLSGRR